MRRALIRTRPDQIAELTRGLLLPLPEVPSVYLEIIADAIAKAFVAIRAKSPKIVTLGTEAEVTTLLEARLNAMIETEPLWSQLVLCVVRGKESLSFDGSNIEARPDLSIYMSNRNRSFPLITEAKIIDAAASKTEVLYCDRGIRRFVEGKYAWGNREAFMLAYVRDRSSIASKLTPYLSKAGEQASTGYLVEKLPSAKKERSFDLAISQHGRAFIYAFGISKMLKPGSIAIWHLWLS